MAEPSAASASTSTLHSPSQLKDLTECCPICNETLGLPRSDGEIETASILPCSHIFGSICIKRWLESEAANHDCPNCRRKMLYRRCGHLIKPCAVLRAPRCVTEEDMPKKCVVCRGSGKLKEELRVRNERRLAEERMLEALRTYLPSMHLIFGGICRSTAESVDGRIEEVKKAWREDVDALCSAEEKGGRIQW